MMTYRITYAVAEGSVLVRGIMGSPAPASMWTGWSWRTLHAPLETVAMRYGFRRISDDEAERLISDGPELIIQAGEIAVTLRPGRETKTGRASRVLERARRGAERLSI